MTLVIEQHCPSCGGKGCSDPAWALFWREYAAEGKTLAYLQDDKAVAAWFHSHGMQYPDQVSGPCGTCGGSGLVLGQIGKDDWEVLQQEGVLCGKSSTSSSAVSTQ
ncbi:MAG: hypothetical protein HUJ30_00685 [Gammaproteobacteria bacterium]|nr:hypothetical protein [Gammaproteobacteria bacterium]